MDWLRPLSIAARQEICSFSKVRTIRKNRVLFYQEDMADAVYVVLLGEIRRIKWRDDGTTFLVGRATAGSWLGLAETIRRGPYLEDSIANSESEVAAIQLSDFEHLMDIPGFQSILNRELAVGYYQVHELLEANSPDSKIARLLLSMLDSPINSNGQSVVRTTQESMADATGLSRETINKHLGAMQKIGLVEISRGSVTLVDIDRLSSLGYAGGLR